MERPNGSVGKSPRSAVSYTTIRIYASALDDAERARIALSKRDMIATLALTEAIEALEHAEKALVRDLQALVVQTPVGPWIASTKGVGAKQMGRLLAQTGDPAERATVERFWAYCGLNVVGGHAPQSIIGHNNYNRVARARAFMIATSCIRVPGCRYRPIYDRERAKWADRPTSEAHKHHHGLRVVAKAVLRDLWKEARNAERPAEAGLS